MTKILNFALEIKGVVGRVAHAKSSDPAPPKKNLERAPICVLSCLCKMLTNCLNGRLISVCKKEKLIHISQIGFKEGYRTSDHIFSLKTLLNKYALEKPSGKLYACFIDFKKAYDSVWHKGLFSKLENFNTGGKFLEIMKDLYENSKCAVKIQNKVTNFSHVTGG